MENLNADQLKEDIDNCIEGECELCSYYDQTACKEHLMHGALALITSQEQRIKELAEKIVQLLSQADCDKAEINFLRKHIESLGETIEMQEQEVDSLTATVKVRGETIEKLQFSVTDISEHNRKLTEENERLRAFKQYFDELYGTYLYVDGWHENGALEPFDNFYESALQEMKGE